MWVETWQTHWVHLTISQCETRGLWKKKHPQTITHTHTHARTCSQRLREVKTCQTVVLGEICVVWMFALVRWAMSFFLLLYEKRRRGRVNGQRACKVRGCQADVSSHFPSLLLQLMFFLHFLSWSCLIISANSPLSHLFAFHFGVWRQAAPSWKWVWKHPGIYQLLLNPLIGCQIPHHSCEHMHKYAHIHTPPDKVKQPHFWQTIDI